MSVSPVKMAAKKLKEGAFGHLVKQFYKKYVNTIFYLKFKKYKKIKKIMYALTPPPNLSNVGDHAQAVAITEWLKENLKDYFILELDKDDVYRYLPAAKRIVAQEDFIFLHSGGNLGDRGIWSENARRLVIQNFPRNKIISLPQTIFFSDTARGKEELERTKNIYNIHKDLTIMARDEYSFKLAKEYFPRCRIMLFPDFVLYLELSFEADKKRRKVLLCLRKDNESSVDEKTRNHIEQSIKNAGEDYDEYDTTLNRNILKKFRNKELQLALDLFKEHRLVITDRLHGIIFSAITDTPCIALKTVDHKLAESVKWFKDLNYVFYAEKPSALPQIIRKALNVVPEGNIDWKRIYFDNLKEKILGS